MVRERFRSSRYVAAAVITVLVFLLGVLLGLVIENERVTAIQRQNHQQQIEFSSLQLQYQYVDQLSLEQNCPALLKAFDRAVESLENSRLKLEYYTQNANTINKQDFEAMEGEYTLAQVRFWLFAKRSKQICNNDIVPIIYFFSTKKECPDCDQQAFILTYLKKLLDDKLLNFALDGRREDEPMITILKSSYNVTSYPTIIIGDRVYEGFVSKEDILKEVCSQYKSPGNLCIPYLNMTQNQSVMMNESIVPLNGTIHNKSIKNLTAILKNASQRKSSQT
ncbi:hypothetical protein J4460_00195 [Candidatus Woesearchaeota archaeon]|nr:MAG: hypothetical protein QS99_C0002G0148 [archaeon GW2011_AR4]MBS3129070.1 hypothetical protein [Candidatus Woesearchaeota archaeon]HIH37804.1 hypothetical protein [Candidatus Woesearchaeota archaeon]HIH48422.1 hypothetical protein [Candidatus Woesearchaeota archaeon]HIJ03929.1 hypothetical protein [Candidatus Woesearchaeota archaeon]